MIKIKRKKLKSGFTLIEILIIVAIIAILAGVVLVAMNPTRRINQSNDSRRWEDITSISSAIGQYIADNKGDVPNCGSDNIPSDGIYRCIGSGAGDGNDYTASVVSWWSFDDANIGIDDSALTNDLTNNNSVVQNIIDKVEDVASASFNGSSSYLSKAESLDGNFPGKSGDNNYDISVTAWVKLSSSGDHIIASKCHAIDDADNSWLFGIGNFAGISNRPYVLLRDNTQNVNYIGLTSLTNNNWHHLAFTFKRDNITNKHEIIIYVDGIEDLRKSDETFVAGFPQGSSGVFTVGYASLVGKYMNGLIDELAVFNTVLTQQQIQEIFVNGLNGQRNCCNLGDDLNPYLHKMPEDPVGGSQENTGYVIRRDPQGAMYIRAPRQSQETSKLIEVSR